MNHTNPPGDPSTEPESRYGTCTRECVYECAECCDTGVLGTDKTISQDYCDCALGRYLARVENEED